MGFLHSHCTAHSNHLGSPITFEQVCDAKNIMSAALMYGKNLSLNLPFLDCTSKKRD